ncbi:MAG: DUF2914 domain-containing protein [Patescibacteria group bacterium]
MEFVQSFFKFLARYKRHLTTAAFLVGFLADIITFRTINLDTSEILLIGYLVIVAGSILILAAPRGVEEGGIATRVREWLPIVHQFAAGNLLSAFLVLYFSSGSLSASWPFLLLVVLAAVGNETFSSDRYRVPFQMTLFFLNLVLFSALALPIALGSLGFREFLLSVGLSLAVFILFTLIVSLLSRHTFAQHFKRVSSGVLGVSVLILILYFTHLMPPIPLSAKSIGFYHTVAKVGDTYIATDERRAWYERFLDVNGVVLTLAPGEPAYLYTSIFAPAHFGSDVVHKWEMFDTASGKWILKNSVRFPILGGRQAGYRGYSITESPATGRWRVSVETPEGAVIGRSYLTVQRIAVPVDTISETLE